LQKLNIKIMGVIQRQGLKSSVLNYLGIFIGAASIVFIYPQALAEYGLITFLTELSIFTAALSSLSLPLIMVKFFPRFNDESKQNNGFLAWAMLANLFGFLLFAGVYFCLRGYILDFYADKSDLEKGHIDYLLVFTFLLSWINLFNYYCSLYQRVVIGTLADFLSKLARPFLVILYLFNYLSISQLVQGLALAYLVIIIILILYTQRMGKLFLGFQTSVLDKKLGWEMLRYSGGATLLILFSTLGLQLDRITVSVYLNMEANGVYGMAQFITNLIAIPLISLGGIIAPIVVKHFQSGDMNAIQQLYQKSADISTIVGVYIGLGIITCIDDLYQMTANYNALAASVVVVGWLVLGKLLDCLGGVSRWILEFSDKYHWGVIFMGLSVVINISLSVVLIPRYGLVGVAVSNLCAVGFYTLARVLVLYHYYKIWPLTRQALGSLGLGLMIFAMMNFIRIEISPLINLICKGLIISVIYFGLVYVIGLSEELNQLISKSTKLFLRKTKK